MVHNSRLMKGVLKMKKLMIAAAVAVSCVAVSHGNETLPEAQVYEVKVTVKTTVANKGVLSPKKNPFVLDGTSSIIYRKQGSQTWKGLIWGCDCETIFGIWGTLPGNNEVVSGVAIWNAKKPYDIVLLDDMHWHVMNAIDQQGTKCECAWTIGESTDTSSAFLSFAGFGTLKLKTIKEEGNLVLDGCGSYINSVSGSVSGWMPAPRIETAGRAAICTFCGVIDEGEEGTSETAEAWNYCPCLGDTDRDFTAVSGSWSIKYSASLSKKLAGATSIIEVYKKFPSSVEMAIKEKIASIKE